MSCGDFLPQTHTFTAGYRSAWRISHRAPNVLTNISLLVCMLCSHQEHGQTHKANLLMCPWGGFISHVGLMLSTGSIYSKILPHVRLDRGASHSHDKGQLDMFHVRVFISPVLPHILVSIADPNESRITESEARRVLVYLWLKKQPTW